ncbi:unnamed protein product [Kuraishia capsulata CBS 1993]|uniref:B30.2/SPRY domain-containing protein n=1 Tax=Kuraishia capsulata CBS 1993 TaxID=1382522 RepID=W6MHS2_9ASCO|nr:uncharacterized protein KUCA_T00001302001 [Kuraishia capsulata CBS 1993]CDK25333.1 unnamed protein product [Kuraishia capsulata CBS 1993]
MPALPFVGDRQSYDFGNVPDDTNLPFIIFVSSLLSFGVLLILIVAIYYIFTNGVLAGFFSEISNSGDPQVHIPDAFTYNEESLKEDELTYLPEMTPEEQEDYLLAKEFFNRNPPRLNYMGSAYGVPEELLLRDRGLHAFWFKPYTDQVAGLMSAPSTSTASNSVEVNSSTSLLSAPINSSMRANYGSMASSHYTTVPFYIEDKTDIVFRTAQTSSTTLNFPIPIKHRNNDCVYFETKLYDFDSENTLISIGLSTSPYPNFRLPGYNFYSVAVETSGYLRINKPFPQPSTCPVILPQLLEGDVVGIGFKSSTGTVFVTHNGKKILDVIKNLKMDLYPCIGSIGGPCRVQVNLGQLGFVFIEANAKKLGFCEGNNEGTIGAPPLYNEVAGISSKENADIILEEGERLPPDYPDWEETFFGPVGVRPSPKNGNSTRGFEYITAEGSSHFPESHAASVDLREPGSKPPSYKEGVNPDSTSQILSVDSRNYELNVSNRLSPPSPLYPIQVQSGSLGKKAKRTQS